MTADGFGDGRNLYPDHDAVPVPFSAPSPRELPDLRVGLLSHWKPGRFFDRIAQAKHARDVQVHQGLRATQLGMVERPAREWETRVIQDATLWWVSADMGTVLNAAADSVPDDVTFDDLVPVLDETLHFGMAVLERSYIGQSTIAGEQPVSVALIVWGPVVLPPFRGAAGGVPAWRVSSYGSLGKAEAFEYHGANAGRVMVGGRLWQPYGRSDWPVGDAVGARLYEGQPDTMHDSFVEDRRMLVALWTLLHQAGIATVSVQRGERHTRKRMVRHALPEHAADVRVVTLRAASHTSSPGESDGRHWTLDHRVLVSGFWRNQPYGPGRSLRRLQWIAPYVKGPEGTELHTPATVRAWKR